MSKEITTVSLNNVVITNRCVSPRTIDELVKLGEEGVASLLPAPVVKADINGRLYLLDGNKRATALTKLGAATIDVAIEEGEFLPTEEDNNKLK